ncbi:hypothetical protein QTN25_009404 [Entamoeba marina]
MKGLLVLIALFIVFSNANVANLPKEELKKSVVKQVSGNKNNSTTVENKPKTSFFKKLGGLIPTTTLAKVFSGKTNSTVNGTNTNSTVNGTKTNSTANGTKTNSTANGTKTDVADVFIRPNSTVVDNSTHDKVEKVNRVKSTSVNLFLKKLSKRNVKQHENFEKDIAKKVKTMDVEKSKKEVKQIKSVIKQKNQAKRELLSLMKKYVHNKNSATLNAQLDKQMALVDKLVDKLHDLKVTERALLLKTKK